MERKSRTQETIEAKELLDAYRMMVLIREFEEQAQMAYTQAKIGGFLHLYVGQEATAVATIGLLKPQDHIVTHYRDHGHALARGLDPKSLMAELFGRKTGCSQGKGGSMHFADASKNFWGGYAIVGAHLLLAVGIAYAIQYREEDGVVMCFFGDGATNGGEFFEALNLAALYKLPVVFVCENNGYAMGTPLQVHSAVTEIYRKACAFDIPSARVDGNDYFATRELAQKALDHARSGKGPYFIEALTQRFRGHSAADPQVYRTREQIEQLREKHDPIARMRRYLVEEKMANDDDLMRIDQEIAQEIQEAIRFADESPLPDPEELWTDVYASPIQ